MDKTTKKMIGWGLTGAVLLAGVIGAGTIIDKPLKPTPLSWEEYLDFVEMVDYEAKAVGGLTLEEVTAGNLYEKVGEQILKREETKAVNLGKTSLSAEDYKQYKEELVQKVAPNAYKAYADELRELSK